MQSFGDVVELPPALRLASAGEQDGQQPAQLGVQRLDHRPVERHGVDVGVLAGQVLRVQVRRRRTEDAESIEVQLGEKKLGLRTAGADDAVAQEKAEAELEDVRLMYVAATRAKDHLLVSRYRAKSGRGKPLAPKELLFVSDLPKTRNMKVMRRVVRAVYLGQDAGDLSSLVNPEAVEALKEKVG